jgi:hypothetical protein
LGFLASPWLARMKKCISEVGASVQWD